MKQPKRNTPQLILSLQPDRPPAKLPADRQRDLASALTELLLRAASASGDSQAERKRTNESETHT